MSLLKRKSGVELSLNTMIVLVLVLLVLLVSAYLLMSGVINFKNVTSCEKNDGHCESKCVEPKRMSGWPCGKDMVCCVLDS